jgi:uncharacterized protein (TIGR03118 family)
MPERVEVAVVQQARVRARSDAPIPAAASFVHHFAHQNRGGPMSRRFVRTFGIAVMAVTGAVTTATPAYANEKPAPNSYVQHNLVSDLTGIADITDKSLVNPWGLAQGPSTPAWVADNGTNVATLYRGDDPVQKVPLTVTIPGDGPTGQVFNPTSGFVVSDGNGHSGPAAFIFDSESGDITGWSPAVPPPPPSTQAWVGVHVPNAIYKGLALASGATGPLLYAANFHAATIDVFDATFTQVHLGGTFTDPNLPRGYAPFNIALLDGRLYVSYARQDADAEDELAGPGRGFVDVFDTSGHLLRRLITHGLLNAPWGMTIAPDDFGRFGGDLLVGNFGDGRIHAYDARSGHFAGTLRDTNSRPIVIDGLWALMFGNGTSADTNALLFSAGIEDEEHGLYGVITPST